MFVEFPGGSKKIVKTDTICLKERPSGAPCGKPIWMTIAFITALGMYFTAALCARCDSPSEWEGESVDTEC